ncbi:MAG: DUF433 domain-containing protein [Planctomycetaceae bacterium]|nr:DUF433 domain-containing protein [Planctomycetaceae bacterium]
MGIDTSLVASDSMCFCMVDLAKYVGCGLYSLKDAARLLKVKPSTLRYWSGELHGAEGIVPRQLEDDRLLTFAELMEFHFVKLFRDHEVSLQAIRKAAKAASKKFHTNYPFTVKQFNTDGRSIFVTLHSRETDKELIEDLQRGQLVFTKLIRPFFKKLEFRGTTEAARFWPLQKQGRIVLDPNRRFGQPIDADTGVPTEALTRALKAGDGQSAADVARWFDIPVEAVRAAVRFERSLAT